MQSSSRWRLNFCITLRNCVYARAHPLRRRLDTVRGCADYCTEKPRLFLLQNEGLHLTPRSGHPANAFETSILEQRVKYGRRKGRSRKRRRDEQTRPDRDLISKRGFIIEVSKWPVAEPTKRERESERSGVCDLLQRSSMHDYERAGGETKTKLRENEWGRPRLAGRPSCSCS